MDKPKPIRRDIVDLAFNAYRSVSSAIDALEAIGVALEDGRGVGGDLYAAMTDAVDIIASELDIDMSRDAVSEKAHEYISSAANVKISCKGIPDGILSALENLRNKKEDAGHGVEHGIE